MSAERRVYRSKVHRKKVNLCQDTRAEEGSRQDIPHHEQRDENDANR
jgi:hypothetical protein